jgi:hypothetical protein
MFMRCSPSAVGGEDDAFEILRAFRCGPFNFERFAAKQVAVESAAGPAATLEGFRAAEPRQTAAPGPKETWLGEAFVHGEDIRRPLGITHAYPLPEVARAVRFYAQVLRAGSTREATRSLVAGHAWRN